MDAGSTPASTAGNPTPDPVGTEQPQYRARHARRRRRWPWFVAASLVAVLLAGAATAVITRRAAENGGADNGGATRGEQSAPPAGVAPAPAPAPQGDAGASGAATSGGSGAGETAAAVHCRYETLPGQNARITPPDRPTRDGPVGVTVTTNRGPIGLELDAAKAPCTVQSFLALATGAYFTDTACHRVTTAVIFVVQCGDPTATGAGGPGYRFDDENLPTASGYARGTLAMANAGPDTNGGQFFIAYRDSPIDPNYPVFGRVTAGMEILDAVAAGGAPNNDGQPNQELIILGVQVD
jgi:peptidyl-prolyl cis-trans isomerase B (cyclophilin B)